MDRSAILEVGAAWRGANPESLGFDAAKLREATAFAHQHENAYRRDLPAFLPEKNAPEGAHGTVIGPTRSHGEPSGIVLRHGQPVAEWGTPGRVDMTFSVTKSFLSAVAGHAFSQGCLRTSTSGCRKRCTTAGSTPSTTAPSPGDICCNRPVSGKARCGDKPDTVDHHREVLGGDNASKGSARALSSPGSYWEYNDVRVNRLSLALLRRLGRPLPVVLKETIMDPIGASEGWLWHGYRNAFVDIDGQQMPSVSGGGHWGGGLWINCFDLARFGHLYLRDGLWGEQRVLPSEWIAMTREPCPFQPQYGFLWWLNTDHGLYEQASEQSYFAIGAGGNLIWIEPELDIVVVLRWFEDDRFDEFATLLYASLSGKRTCLSAFSYAESRAGACRPIR